MKRYSSTLYLIDYIVYGLHSWCKIYIQTKICRKPFPLHPGLATSLCKWYMQDVRYMQDAYAGLCQVCSVAHVRQPSASPQSFRAYLRKCVSRYLLPRFSRNASLGKFYDESRRKDLSVPFGTTLHEMRLSGNVERIFRKCVSQYLLARFSRNCGSRYLLARFSRKCVSRKMLGRISRKCVSRYLLTDSLGNTHLGKF